MAFSTGPIPTENQFPCPVACLVQSRWTIEVINEFETIFNHKSPRKEVARPTTGAGTIYLPFLGGFSRSMPPMHDSGYPTSCKIILGHKIVLQWIFRF